MLHRVLAQSLRPTILHPVNAVRYIIPPASRSNKRSPITGQCLPALVLRKQDLIESFDKFLVVLIRIWLRHVLTRFSARPIQQSIRLLTHPKTEHRVAFESDHLSDKVFGSPYYVRHPGYKPA